MYHEYMKSFDEKELVHKLDKILKVEFGTNLAFHEFSAGYGIADLVFAPNFSFKKTTINRTPLTSFNGLNLLLSLTDQKEYEIPDILKVFNQLTVNEIKRELRMLVNCGYLKKIGKNSYLKTVKKNHINPIKKIVAVEVKLNDHRGGLIQARRYQYFADESYLAILKETEGNINYEEFNKYNIGLILFDSKTNTIEVNSPTRTINNFKDPVRLFAKEMMCSRYLNFSF